jgi:hypothetical protein
MSSLENVKEHFRPPIYYNPNRMELKQNIINDLELVQTIDASGNTIYSYCFNTTNDLSVNVTPQLSQYYTTDTNFLKDSQNLLKTYKRQTTNSTTGLTDYNQMLDIWREVKTDTGFKEKYYYIDWSMFEHLNKSEYFLEAMSVYNMASPIISFFVPIIFLIIPFFIIRMKGLSVTMNEYISVLKVVISNHAIGKLFTKFNEVSFNERVYLMISAAFYVFSIYQNILVCYRFNNNMYKIHKFLKDTETYLENTTNTMNNYLLYSSKLITHSRFNETLTHNMNVLLQFKQSICGLSEYKITNYKKALEIGHVLKYFYQLYEDPTYNAAFLYSFGFNGYIDCIEGLQTNVEERKINFASFIDDYKKASIVNNYYACLKDSSPVKNTIHFKKNIIVTGPNASGKTTILKSSLINIILTQQFGCGFYDSAEMKPYKYIHCYLNIPDTSGRDSLFQAEARRCKEIIDVVDANKDDGHFCAFDELYSGTNPEEAVSSATAFMEYLIKNKNLSCILTTHFVKVCKKLKKNANIRNYQMIAKKSGNAIKYTYKLDKGISTVKGGVSVLCDMNYPAEIINNSTKCFTSGRCCIR